MTTIGITGGIGSGKSIVSRVLRLKGFHVYDCDYQARMLMDNSCELKEMLAEKIGPEAVDANGSINRRYIGSRVFGNPELLGWLNSVVHEMVRADFIEWRRRLGSERINFIESAILYSSGLDCMTDEVWLVSAPENMRVDRAALRDKCATEDIYRRIAAQKGEADAADARIIYNDHHESLLLQIDKLIINQA